METDDIPDKPLSNWQPITNKHDLAVLGKLAEETGELIQIIARTIIQGGLNEVDPETGKSNKKALEEEIADVRAMLSLCIQDLDLDLDIIINRMRRKVLYKEPWLNSLKGK